MRSPFSFDREDNVVADISADEITGLGYSRQALTGENFQTLPVTNRTTITADSPAFGSIAAGETVTDCVIFETATNELVVRVPIDNTATNGQPFGIDFNGTDPGIFMSLRELAS